MVLARNRLLFVDDEASIRLTLPPLLAKKGYEVTVVATVKEGLEKIHSQPFDVLLADLNIGGAGDGFILVGAMRQTQPDAVNIIITGYPDFESALDAIRKQVDGYVVKPANIDELSRHIEETLIDKSKRAPSLPTKSVAQIVDEGRPLIIERWLKLVHESGELSELRIPDEQRIGHLPALLGDLVEMLRKAEGQTTAARIDTAKKHGELRKRQKYTLPMIVEETRLLERSIYNMLHANLLSADFSSLIPDMTRISDSLQLQLKASLEAYLAVRPKRSH